MSRAWMTYFMKIILVLAFVIKLEAVTVNPLCPTNKIAPHRRSPRSPPGGDRRSPRTLGVIYNLLVPDNRPSQLQEDPENDPDDCGDIEDYDENDLSSLTPNQKRRQGQKLWGNQINAFLQQLSLNSGPVSTFRPQYKPTRPPTGGYFGTNGYRPQPVQQPSDYIKPVHEGGSEPHITYRPNVVGAPSGQIVGAVQVKPTRDTPEAAAQTLQQYPNYAYPSYEPHANTHRPTNRPRNMADPSILESFIDLLF